MGGRAVVRLPCSSRRKTWKHSLTTFRSQSSMSSSCCSGTEQYNISFRMQKSYTYRNLLSFCLLTTSSKQHLNLHKTRMVHNLKDGFHITPLLSNRTWYTQPCSGRNYARSLQLKGRITNWQHKSKVLILEASCRHQEIGILC